MKRFLILLSAVLLVTGCGIGHHGFVPGYVPGDETSYEDYYPGSRHHHRHSTSPYSRDSYSGLAFYAERSKNIEVSVDHQRYRIKTLKYNASRNQRNFEKALENTIPVRPGVHYVRVRRNGQIIYDQRLYVSAGCVVPIYL